MLRRSKLFCPGSRPDMIPKAAGGAADMVVLDLEDAVREADKASARNHVRSALTALDFGRKERGVRINGLETVHWFDDLAGVFCRELDVVHVPKAGGPRDIWVVEAVLADLERKAGRQQPVRIIPTLETATGLEHARTIAGCSPRIAAVQFGLGDLVAGLGLVPAPHRLAYYRTQVVLAAHAAGVQALDTVFFDIKDAAGYRADAEEARGCGMRGKSCVHPAQVGLANTVFSPTPGEIERARSILAAYDAAQAQGLGAVAFQGRMIDRPVAAEARSLLALASELHPEER